MKFNINHTVKVKLTEVGIAELERQHKELQAALPSVGDFDANAWKGDEDGYNKFQLHDLMARFGHMLYCGSTCPFETEIIISENS